MPRLAGRRCRASPSSISAHFVSTGVLSTKPMRRRTSAASCSYELSHTGCRKLILAACARSGSASSAKLYSSRSAEHTSELQSPYDLVCRLLLGKKEHTSELQLPHDLVGVLLLGDREDRVD